MEKRGLGKGLSALIPQRDKMKEVLLKELDTSNIGQAQVVNIALEKISPNARQPREDFVSEKLDELVASIKEKGVIQPVLVRRKNENFELIAGERRWRAAKKLQLAEIPAIIKDVNDKDALELALIENLQRENLNPIEEAHAYQRLMQEFTFTQDEVAQGVGKSRAAVANTLRLLKLPSAIQEALRKDLITMGHAKAILAIDDAKIQQQVCNLVIGEGLSVREIENLSRDQGRLQNLISKKRKKVAVAKDIHITSLEEELKNILGTKVMIQHSKKRGKVQIEYYSLEDLDRLLDLFRKLI